MYHHYPKRFVKLLAALISSGVLLMILSRLITTLYAQPRIYTIDDAPEIPVAIVFGAGLWRDGTPTPVLRDRIATAAQLYFSGKVEKLLMSGGIRSEAINEPAAMRIYAMGLGIPDEAIILDFEGRRTYDSCYRADKIFGVKSAILVTQKFHLPRALYTCRVLGIQAIGVSADRRQYRNYSLLVWNIRELVATLTAFWDVHIKRPALFSGESMPVRPYNAQ